MEHFGRRLRKLRGERSQSEVAKDMGIPQTTLSTLENQETIPRGEVLHKLADHYRVSISYFYNAESSGPKSSDAARAWLYQVRKAPVTGKETIATQSNVQLGEDVKKQIADKIKQKYEDLSNE